MSYMLVLTKQAEKQLQKLDRKQQYLLSKWLDENLNDCDDPRDIPGGKPLTEIKEGWRYRVGSYRIIVRIDDDRVVVTVLRVAMRKEVYRNLIELFKGV